jgi:hypothetical protein
MKYRNKNIVFPNLKIYGVNQDLCDKIWEAIHLAGRIIFIKQPMFSDAFYELNNIEKKTGRRWHLQLWNQLFIYFFKYICGQITVGVQSVYPEPDHIHYTVIAVTLRLCRTFVVYVEFVHKQRVYSHNQFLYDVNWCDVHDTLHIPPKK